MKITLTKAELNHILNLISANEIDEIYTGKKENWENRNQSISMKVKKSIKNLKPIPLTEEWLIKIGFAKINHINGYSFYSLSKSKINKCHIDIYDSKTQYMGYSVKHCKYLHELQNLYFVLTGLELIINN